MRQEPPINGASASLIAAIMRRELIAAMDLGVTAPRGSKTDTSPEFILSTSKGLRLTNLLQRSFSFKRKRERYFVAAPYLACKSLKSFSIVAGVESCGSFLKSSINVLKLGAFSASSAIRSK